MQIDFTQKEIDFMKRVLNVDDPTFLVERVVRQWFGQLVNQEFKTADVESKIDVINSAKVDIIEEDNPINI